MSAVRHASVLAFLFVCVTPISASGNSIGTDLNLTAHPIAGAMGGAGYTISLEPSTAVFGNPASLSQLPGIQFNLGATWIHFFGNNNRQSFAGLENESTSAATDYLVPVTAATFAITEDLFLGVGIEADAGIGSDLRTDSLTLLGTSTDTMVDGTPVPGTAIPALSQIISLNGNVALAYELFDQLTIGAAFTLGYGIFQVGTAGNTAGLATATLGMIEDFGGTTSSVNDIGVGGSVGLSWNAFDGFYISAAYKSAVKYRFEGVVSTTVTADGSQAFQSLAVQQPQEVVFGVGLHDPDRDFVAGIDVAWKNWENADTYEDLYKNQWLVMVGGQYEVADVVALRLGYHFSSKLLRDTPSNQIGGLSGLGTIPFGDAGEPFSSTLTTLTQTALVPVVWQHTITAGVGVRITDHVQANAFAAVALLAEASRTAGPLSDFLGSPVVYTADLDPQLSVGVGVQVAFGHETEPAPQEATETGLSTGAE